jgi:hypothetical protein
MVFTSLTWKGHSVEHGKWFEEHAQQQKEKQDWLTNKPIKNGA